MCIKVLVVDDHGILREGIDLIINQAEGMEVVARASNGFEGISLARELRPDVILMDVSMPELNGIDASAEILSENPDVKILALSAHCSRRFVEGMLKVGVCGYALKDTMADELVDAIRTVYSGKKYLSKKVLEIVVKSYSDDELEKPSYSGIDKLNLRERKVLQLIAENKTIKETAKLLSISEKTVESRRRSIMDKLGLRGTAELTKFAIREGLTSVDF